jgi:hypothetical protein
MSNSFKVGDRVRFVKAEKQERVYYVLLGMTGTVVSIRTQHSDICLIRVDREDLLPKDYRFTRDDKAIDTFTWRLELINSIKVTTVRKRKEIQCPTLSK